MNLKNNGPVTSSEEKVHELVAEFHRCEDQGNPVSPKDFMARHPEHADTLQSYFDGVKAVDSMTGPPPQEHTFISADSKAVANDQTVIENSASIEGSRRVSADAPPTRFGRYKILKELGRGAMGAVYLAQDEQLDRKVALKIPQFGGALNSGLLERFYREARAAGNLRHPGICPVYDVGEIGGQHYITMAYIEGRPLRDFSKSSKRQADKQTARVIRKIALAMAEAHAQNVIHRDLKPANIMIDTKNEPVVMDFGLARRAAENEEKLTHTGTVIGTPAYMSPEQVDGDNENVGPPADIYSLGVVFYELLTGELPFKGNLMSILKQISMKQPRPPIELHADVDPFLQDLCLKMLEKRAADRPKSMAEVAKSLSEWLQGLHAPTDESGMLETSRVPGRSKKKKAGAIESTDPVTVPGFHRLEPQPEEFPAFADLPSIDSAELSGTTMTPIRLPAGFGKHPPGNRKWLLFGGLGGAAILLARIVFFFTLGGKYDVQITLDDPSMSLQVDGEAVVIEGNGSPIRLSAGEHTLHVEMNGFESETDSFTVKKDGKNALHVARLDEKKKLQIHVGGKPTVPAGTVLSTAEKNAGLPDSGRVASATVTAPPLASPPTAKAPFDAAQARTHQEAWARHMGTTVETTNSVGAKMILIPPGEFLMGSTNEQVAAALKLADEVKADQLIKDGIQNAERPQHKVVITKPFLMSSTEVTIGEFKKFVEASRYVTEAEKYGSGDSASEVSNDKTQENLPQKNWRAPGHVVTDDSPAGQITWNDAVAYCRWLSTQEKTTYRLPTEAEWEYACRAGTTTQYSFGDDAAKLGLYGWYDKNAPDNSHPVGTKLPNGFGLFDMHGNVLEWCGDSYEEKWYEQSAGIDPSGPSRSSSRHVLRGGYWRHNASVCRSAYRDHNVPSYRRFNLGFRYVRVLDVPAPRPAR